MRLIFRDKMWIAESTYAEKDIPKGAGFRWNPDRKCWWTDDLGKAQKLEQFADPEALELLKKAKEQKVQKIEASKAAEADIEIPAPEGLAYLPFQKAGVAYIKNLPNALIADDMGLGKTIQAIGLINLDASLKRILVVCPASIRLNWKRELEKWLVRTYTIEIVGKNGIPASGIAIINYDILHKYSKELREANWDLVIFDESQKLKTPKAQRTVAAFGKFDKDPAKRIEPIPAKRKLFLTGTPILNKPIELWPMLSSLGIFKSWYQYVTQYCNGHQTRWGWDVTGASNLGELQEKLRSTIMIRRLKADVLKELPAKRRQVIELPANGAAEIIQHEQDVVKANETKLQALQEAVELSKINDSEEDYIVAVNALRKAAGMAFTEMAKVRHDTAVAKIPYVIDHLKNMLESIDKIVVFAHHHDVVHALAAEFGEEAVVLTGETKMNERQAVVDNFQNDPSTKLFIGSITAAGVGLTLTASSHVVFAELDWVPANLTQAEDRTHRIGQSNSVLVQHLVLEGSIDAVMAKRIIAKQEIISTALDKTPVIEETPILPIEAPATKEIGFEEATKQAADILPEEIANVHSKLRILAGMCDGAVQLDGVGFNKYDSRIGHQLAGLAKLTPRQAVFGRRIVKKYHRQLGG